jgi:hypothetical protein
MKIMLGRLIRKFKRDLMRESEMEQVRVFLTMVIYIQVSGRKEKEKEWVSVNFTQEDIIKVIGSKTSSRGMAFKCLKVELLYNANLKKEK